LVVQMLKLYPACRRCAPSTPPIAPQPTITTLGKEALARRDMGKKGPTRAWSVSQRACARRGLPGQLSGKYGVWLRKLRCNCDKLTNDIRRLVNLVAKFAKPFGKVPRDT
jgi:hypothetical protein